MMLFTNERGETFEGVEHVQPHQSLQYGIEDGWIIRPVSLKPKWEVTNICGIGWAKVIVRFEPHISEDLAQLIKEAVEALMAEIFTPSGLATSRTTAAVVDARTALKGAK